MTVAATVIKPNSPLAADIRSLFSTSGKAPSLAGEKSALCAPVRATTVNSNSELSSTIANTPKLMMTTSAILQAMITLRLENRSAR